MFDMDILARLGGSGIALVARAFGFGWFFLLRKSGLFSAVFAEVISISTMPACIFTAYKRMLQAQPNRNTQRCIDFYGISTFEEVLCLYGLYTYFQQKGSNLQGRPMVTPLTSSTLLAKRCAVMRFPVEVFSFCLHGACWRLLHMPGRWRIWKWERRIAQGPLTFPLNSPWYKQRLLSHREKATKST